MKFKNKNQDFAQGTIEYLIIMAIVIVIGLVIVGMTSNIFDSNNIVEKNNKLKNLIGTNGITVTEGIIKEGGDGFLSIKNNSGETLQITNISTTNKDLSYTPKTIPIGSINTFTLSDLDLDCPCTGTEPVSCTFLITFQTSAGNIKKAEIEINNSCSDESVTSPIAEPVLLCPTYTGLQNKDGNKIICDCNDLQNISLDLDANYLLGQNIDCSDTINREDNMGFDPIPNFNGILFGNNKTISRMYQRRCDDFSFEHNICRGSTGFFADIKGGLVQNFTFSDFNFYGGCAAGAIASNIKGEDQYLIQDPITDEYTYDLENPVFIDNVRVINGTIDTNNDSPTRTGSVVGNIFVDSFCPTNTITNNMTLICDESDECNTMCKGIVGDNIGPLYDGCA